MTRNTRLYKIKSTTQSYIYRDLTAKEIDFLDSIKNDTVRYEMAAKVALVDCDKSVPWPLLQQIGARVLEKSKDIIIDKDLFEITIKESRDKLESDTLMFLISHVIKYFPNESIIDLMNLTYKDLIELVCLAETMNDTRIFNVGKSPIKRKGRKLVNPNEFPDDGKGLQEKMNELNSMLGYGLPK